MAEMTPELTEYEKWYVKDGWRGYEEGPQHAAFQAGYAAGVKAERELAAKRIELIVKTAPADVYEDYFRACMDCAAAIREPRDG